MTPGKLVLAEIMEEIYDAICERQKTTVLRTKVSFQENGRYPFRHGKMCPIVRKGLQDEPLAIEAVAEIQQVSKDLRTEVLVVLVYGEPATLGKVVGDVSVESLDHRVGYRSRGVHVGKFLVVHAGLHDDLTGAGMFNWGDRRGWPRMALRNLIIYDKGFERTASGVADEGWVVWCHRGKKNLASRG